MNRGVQTPRSLLIRGLRRLEHPDQLAEMIAELTALRREIGKDITAPYDVVAALPPGYGSSTIRIGGCDVVDGGVRVGRGVGGAGAKCDPRRAGADGRLVGRQVGTRPADRALLWSSELASGGGIGETPRILSDFSSCPREESNLRTRFRKPLLYPLSYEGR